MDRAAHVAPARRRRYFTRRDSDEDDVTSLGDMFGAAEVGNRIDKATFKRDVPKVRAELLQMQRAIAQSPLAPVVHIGGGDELGKVSALGTLLGWLDARGVESVALPAPSDEERERPRFWRFWRLLPPRGQMAVLIGSWYTNPIVDRVYGRMDDVTFEREMRRIRDFERMLVQEGVPIIKFWLHLPKSVQKKRLAKVKRDPASRWLVGEEAWTYFKRYDRFRSVAEAALRLTSTGVAPWHVVESTNDRYRNLTVATTLIAALREAQEVWASSRAQQGRRRRAAAPKPAKINVIRQLDLSVTIETEDYEAQLVRQSAKLGRLARQLHEAGRSMILAFEGPDAAGKGSAIRRLAAAMDPRLYRVISVGAPTDEESARPYLWRFWRHLPRQGRVTIYDRSWYGRVLVERLEGFAARDEWSRAYAEINEFEAQLSEFGIVLLKFWLAISPEEQLRRFRDRQTTPYKQYKITEEDWRNRRKWDAYEAAACDMIERTSTSHAPWVLVEAEDKRWARVKVLKTVCSRLADALTA
jgi:polyphosphate:AMP phosphotransferase